jgi:hypothetical protein
LPSGATLENAADDEPLGEAPWHHEQAPRDAILPVRVRLPGYRPRLITLDGNHDEHRQVRLEKLRARPTTTPAVPAAMAEGEDDDVQTVR